MSISLDIITPPYALRRLTTLKVNHVTVVGKRICRVYVWNAEEEDQDCASYSQLSEIRSAFVCGRLGLVQTSRSRSRSRSIHQRWSFQRKIKIGSEELHRFDRRWRRGSEWYPKRCPSRRIRFHCQVPFQSSCNTISYYSDFDFNFNFSFLKFIYLFT